MKFCKKCHRRVVEEIGNHLELSVGHTRVCVCRGWGFGLMDMSVVKRFNAELGVHKVEKQIMK